MAAHQRITAKPLFLELEQHPGAVHIIDDCEQLFSEKSALTLLRSALGGERVKGRRERKVSYSVAGSKARVMEFYFFGAIIFTFESPIGRRKARNSCCDVTHPVAEFRSIRRPYQSCDATCGTAGYVGESGSMSAHECVEVIEFVIDLAGELKCRLDLRWIEHGYGHYLTQATCGGTVDWRDQVKFHMMSTLTYFDHTPQVTPEWLVGGVQTTPWGDRYRSGNRQHTWAEARGATAAMGTTDRSVQGDLLPPTGCRTRRFSSMIAPVSRLSG